MERAEIERLLAVPDNRSWKEIILLRSQANELLHLALLGKRAQEAPVIHAIRFFLTFGGYARVEIDQSEWQMSESDCRTLNEKLSGQRVALVGVE